MIKKENSIFIIVSISLIFILFFTMVGGRVFQKQIHDFKNEQTRSPNTVEINWEELYPYDITIETVDSGVKKQDVSLIDKLTNKISKFSNLGDGWSGLIYKYDDIAKAGYVISSKLTDPSVGKSCIKLKNGYWIGNNSGKILLDSAQEAVASYASLQKYVSDGGMDFLYFYAPSKECKVDDELPDRVVSYTNENIDMYLEAMDSFGINYVDLRNTLHQEGLDHYSMFYVTDHHWMVESGLWAASKITQELNLQFGISMIDARDVGTYKPVTYENAEFGSAGQGVTHFVADSEDFTILFPEYETNYRLEIPNQEIDVTGAFEDIFVDYDRLNEFMEQGGGHAYGTILCGNPPYEKITNLNNPDGPKMFMIRDSFSIVVAPYLAASCSELLMLDTRPDNGNFTGSIINCINDFNPDVVVILQSFPQSIVLNKP